jgi:hypothetical protein
MTTFSGQGSALPSTAVDADAFNAFEAAGWDDQATTFADSFGRITRRLVDPLLDAAEVGSGSRVVDVATGPGYAAAKAAERGTSLVVGATNPNTPAPPSAPPSTARCSPTSATAAGLRSRCRPSSQWGAREVDHLG